MMEQMLKLCMFLMRAKLTITEAAGGWVEGVGGGVVWTSLGSSPLLCRYVQSEKKTTNREGGDEERARVMSQS